MKQKPLQKEFKESFSLLPTVADQQEIASTIEALLAHGNALKQAGKLTNETAELLRQAILKRALSGEFVDLENNAPINVLVEQKVNEVLDQTRK